MKYGDVPGWISITFGACTFVVLQQHLLVAWGTIYPGAQLPGLERVIRVGLLEAWSRDAPEGVRTAQFTLFGMAMVLGLVRLGSNLSETLTFWFGFMMPVVFVLVAGRVFSEFFLPHAEALGDWSTLSAEDFRRLGRVRLSTAAFVIEAGRVLIVVALGTTAAYLIQGVAGKVRSLLPGS